MSSIKSIDDFVSSVANNDIAKLLSFHSQQQSSSAVIINVNSSDATGDTAIEVAITTSNHKLLKLLLERFKCDPNVSGKKRNQTPLRLASRRNDVKSCELLIQFGADVNASGGKILPELAEALSNTSFSSSTNVEPEDGWTPLHIAVFGMKKNVINFFLENEEIAKKIDFSIQTKAEGATVLHFAAAQGLFKTTLDILSRIPTPKQRSDIILLKDNNGDTALHSALHYRLSKTFGGKYMPPETPQWSIAFSLAACCQTPEVFSVKNNVGDVAFQYLQGRVPNFENVLVALSSEFGAQGTTLPTGGIDFEKIAAIFASSNDDQQDENNSTNGGKEQAIKDLFLGVCDNPTKIFKAFEQLERERVAGNEKQKEQIKRKEEIINAVPASGDHQNNANNNIDPHGMGIDIRNLKPGEDPSNGECPFLKMRADAAKNNKNKNNHNNSDANWATNQVLVIAIASFVLGCACGVLVVKRK